MENLNENDKDEIITHIQKLLGVWNSLASTLMKTLIILGVLAIASSLFVTTFASKENVLLTKICSFATTLILTLLTSFNLSKKANGVRNGWRHLNAAFFRYKANSIDINELIKAYLEGEVMLGGVDFNYDTTQLKATVSKAKTTEEPATKDKTKGEAKDENQDGKKEETKGDAK